MRELESIHKAYEAQPMELVKALRAFVEHYYLTQTDQSAQANRRFSEEDLELVVYLTLSATQ